LWFIFYNNLTQINNLATLIVIGGPTASGKTGLAIELAKELNTEIISADSRQCFKEISIGTAKASPAELSSVKHHFIDCLSVSETVNAGKFTELADEVIAELSKTKDYIIVAGGTGLYIKSLIEGLDNLPHIPEEFRKEIKSDFEAKGLESFVNELRNNDPDYAAKVDLHNHARVIRAIELMRFTGKPYSSLIGSKPENPRYKSISFCIDIPRPQLYSRINNRVDQMMEHGLLEEVKSVNNFKANPALQTVGYKEMFDYIDRKFSINEAVDLIKQHTRNYAKRQLTWFRHQGNYRFVEPKLSIIKEYLRNEK
jgi:tRNA dimethylallyltransferase